MNEKNIKPQDEGNIQNDTKDNLKTKEEGVIEDIIDSDASHLAVAFYYPWYGNPEVNGKWLHWNHQVLVDNGKFFEPPDEIGANFYPQLGPYSSTDRNIVDQHMKQLVQAKIGIICISWWGKEAADSQLLDDKGFTDSTVDLLLEFGLKYNIKVCFHHEPYKGRNPSSVVADLKYAIDRYGDHPAFFRWASHGNRPVFFVYDSYLTSKEQWATILNPSSSNTIRNTKYDSIMLGLHVEHKDKELILQGHFDGGYTYFATDGFTFGSSTRNWKGLSDWSKSNNKIFVPSVGPGYDDTRIRPWNSVNRRDRMNGGYYDKMWSVVESVEPPMVSITSFNEWHEGTQIEPSVPKKTSSFTYSDFEPLEPDYYLRKTREWIVKLEQWANKV